jgi:hypothetical protein
MLMIGTMAFIHIQTGPSNGSKHGNLDQSLNMEEIEIADYTSESSTCKGYWWNAGPYRCLQYQWKRSVPMGNGSKRGVDAADRLIENSPIKVMWVMSRAIIICPWIIGQKDAELSYFGSYTLITLKKKSHVIWNG